MSLLQNSNAISAGGYDVNNSLRFRASANAYLNRTFSTATNQDTWSMSFWIKLGSTAGGNIFSDFSSGGDRAALGINSSGQFYVDDFNGGATRCSLTSTQVFRDYSSWYHFLIVFEVGNATSTDRVKLFVNNQRVTLSGTFYASTSTNNFNQARLHYIGYNVAGSTWLDGYLAEVNFIDGQALTPSSFGATDATTGVWQPKAYTGTYGTNGFYLKFSDIATTSGSNAGLGKDFSGNTNYWTTNNISVTSGTTYDAMTDSPTNTSATVANYATLNPLSYFSSGTITLSNGNLTVSDVTSAYGYFRSTMACGSNTYFEVNLTSIGTGSNGINVGLCTETSNPSTNSGVLQYDSDGKIYLNGSVNTTVATLATGDIVGITYNPSTGSAAFYKNNTLQATISTGFSALNVFGIVGGGSSTNSQTLDANFGQRPFSYTPPTGFNRLNTYNLPTPTILQGNKYMDATLYAGNTTTVTATNAGAFKPDLVWIKDRTSVASHVLTDSVRGTSSRLETNNTNAESSNSNTLTNFNSNGFTFGSSVIGNENLISHVGWQWQAGQGSTSSNTSGSITSTVSVNTTAGFSVVTYTGTGANATVGHGLGVAPKMIITKGRDSVVGATNWSVYHASIGNTQRLVLNSTAAAATVATIWNNTSPTSTVFSLGTNGDANGNTATYVAYCWADVSGYSKAFSYTGNGSADGPFVYTGFRPKFMMMKRTDSTGDWYMVDSSRATYNQIGPGLNPNTSSAEFTLGSPTGGALDFLSNGFKWRGTYIDMNANGGTYIGIAFAENPFKNSLAR